MTPLDVAVLVALILALAFAALSRYAAYRWKQAAWTAWTALRSAEEPRHQLNEREASR